MNCIRTLAQGHSGTSQDSVVNPRSDQRSVNDICFAARWQLCIVSQLAVSAPHHLLSLHSCCLAYRDISRYIYLFLMPWLNRNMVFHLCLWSLQSHSNYRYLYSKAYRYNSSTNSIVKLQITEQTLFLSIPAKLYFNFSLNISKYSKPLF